MEKITFVQDDQTSVEFFVLEKTTLRGVEYILVTEEEEGDADAFILKDVSAAESEESEYIVVEDEEELEVIAKVFENLLEDITFA